ncbi:MAG: hypothetical protein U1A27_01370 [Phycisphaerae bacterium]
MTDAPPTRTDSPRRAFGLALLGLLLALAGLPLWMALLDHHWIHVSGAPAWAALGLGLLIALVAARRDPRLRTRLIVGVNTLLLLAFAFMFFVMARLPAAPATAALSTAPDFTLPDHTGRMVSLAEARAAGPTLLVFYRGFW